MGFLNKFQTIWLAVWRDIADKYIQIYMYEQGYNARKVNGSCVLCVHIETSSHWADFVNKNRCLSACFVSVEDKSI